MASAGDLGQRLNAFLDGLVADPGKGPPGAVLLVARNGVVLAELARGAAQLAESGAPAREMRPDMIFDLGSITKVAATTAVAMCLVERGKLDLDSPVAYWLAGFRGRDRARVTVRHLLTHRAGLWEWWPLYLHASEPACAIEQLCALPLRYPVDQGRHYSDLGFMLLGEIVQRAGGDRLDRLAARLVFNPLGMSDTGFAPPTGEQTRIAATSRGDAYERNMIATGDPYPVPVDGAGFDRWRHTTLVGEVNDGNAHHAFKGVAGHAGLFSTARDLAAFGSALAGEASDRSRRVFESATVALFTSEPSDRGQGLGFWTRRLKPAGCQRGFGHSGFPGTELLVEPDSGLVIVLLTNRLHAPRGARPLDRPWGELLRLLCPAERARP